jgi:hypothetical protein
VFHAIALNLPQIAYVEERQFHDKSGRIRHMGMRVATGIVVAALCCAASSLISNANAQTISSSYASTSPKDCRVTNRCWS